MAVSRKRALKRVAKPAPRTATRPAARTSAAPRPPAAVIQITGLPARRTAALPAPRELAGTWSEHEREPQPDRGRSLDEHEFVEMDDAGTLRCTAEQIAILTAPATNDELEILPTGEVYMSHVHIRRRLIRAFGPGGWALVPTQKPSIAEQTVMRAWVLRCLDSHDGKSKTVATAAGEAEFQPGNKRISMATPLESGKSNALTRCVKDLGIGLECWDRKWTARWRAEHATKVFCSGNKKGQNYEEWRWRLKDAPPFYDEQRFSVGTHQTQSDIDAGEDMALSLTGAGSYGRQAAPVSQNSRSWGSRPHKPITEAQRQRLYRITQKSGRTEDEVKRHIQQAYGVASSREVLQDQYDALCEWVMGER